MITPESSKTRSQSRSNPTEIAQLYMGEIGRRPLLSKEEEKALAERVQAGDQSARAEMIEANLRLVVSIAKKYLRKDASFLDLVEDGNIGLIKAVDRFDPSLGYRFSTYATYWIRDGVERGIMNNCRTIRIPIHIAKRLNRCFKAKRELEKNSCKSPTHREIARYLDWHEDEVSALFAHADAVQCSSASTLGPELKAWEHLVDRELTEHWQTRFDEQLEQQIATWLNELPEELSQIVCARYGFRGHPVSTLQEVGDAMGMSRERVRQLQSEALDKLRMKVSTATAESFEAAV